MFNKHTSLKILLGAVAAFLLLGISTPNFEQVHMFSYAIADAGGDHMMHISKQRTPKRGKGKICKSQADAKVTAIAYCKGHLGGAVKCQGRSGRWRCWRK